MNAAIHAGSLDGSEAPFEMAWLSLRREFDALADTMANGGEVERPQMLRLAAERRHTEAAMRAAGRAAQDNTETDTDAAEDKDDVWERLEAVEQQRRLDAARLRAEGAGDAVRIEQSAYGDEGLPETKSVPVRRAGYAGSAAGPMADMVAHGRTWRRQDAGGG
ncbi:hypothetical protein [Hyphomonas sp.]|uniref:hypothetical protein n=1 Tax=Hyphomonas sp. TaxID=87 RepID=UPI0030F4B65B